MAFSAISYLALVQSFQGVYTSERRKQVNGYATDCTIEAVASESVGSGNWTGVGRELWRGLYVSAKG